MSAPIEMILPKKFMVPSSTLLFTAPCFWARILNVTCIYDRIKTNQRSPDNLNKIYIQGLNSKICAGTVWVNENTF